MTLMMQKCHDDRAATIRMVSSLCRLQRHLATKVQVNLCLIRNTELGISLNGLKLLIQ